MQRDTESSRVSSSRPAQEASVGHAARGAAGGERHGRREGHTQRGRKQARERRGQGSGPVPSLQSLPGRYAICRLEPQAGLPEWAASAGGVVSITRTEHEVSIVAPQAAVPENVQAERGWAALRVAGTIDFSVVGLLARLTAALAEARVPVFVISTYETDILLVREQDWDAAVTALAAVAKVSGLHNRE